MDAKPSLRNRAERQFFRRDFPAAAPAGDRPAQTLFNGCFIHHLAGELRSGLIESPGHRILKKFIFRTTDAIRVQFWTVKNGF
jgi:hypothetical protein